MLEVSNSGFEHRCGDVYTTAWWCCNKGLLYTSLHINQMALQIVHVFGLCLCCIIPHTS